TNAAIARLHPLPTIPLGDHAPHGVGQRHRLTPVLFPWVRSPVPLFGREPSLFLNIFSAVIAQAFFADTAQRRARKCHYTWHSAAPACDWCWRHTTRPWSV